MNTQSRWLDNAGLMGSLIAKSDWEYLDGTTVHTKKGKIPDWESAAFQLRSLGGFDYAEDSWIEPSIAGTSADLVFGMQLPPSHKFTRNPVQTLADQDIIYLQATYATPQFYFDDFTQMPGTRSMDSIILARATTELPLELGAVLVEREGISRGGVEVNIDFFWPNPIAGPIAGYTAPLLNGRRPPSPA